MQHIIFVIFLCMISFAFNGCTSYRTTAENPKPRPFGMRYPSKEISKDSKAVHEQSEPKDEITLRQAIALALLKNPDLAAFSWEVRAREAKALQASLLPNPEIDVELENLGGSNDFSGFNQTETTVQLSQLVELSGKRWKRTRVAALDGDLAAWDYEQKKLDVLSGVTLAFIDLLSIQQQVSLNQELVRIAEEFVNVVERRVRAGATSPAEASRAQVTLANARVDLGRSQRMLQVGRNRLASTWGSLSAEFINAVGALEVGQAPPDLATLHALLEQNPEIARWAVAMEKQRAILSLEKAHRIPDPSVGAGFRRISETKDNAFVVGLSVPLPIFDRNQGNIQEAQHRIRQTEQLNRATRIQITAKITQAYQMMVNAFNEAETLQNSILPEAQKAFDTINAGFNLGKFGFLDVLDAQRTLFDSRTNYLTAATEYYTLKTELERLLGQNLDTIQ